MCFLYNKLLGRHLSHLNHIQEVPVPLLGMAALTLNELFRCLK